MPVTVAEPCITSADKFRELHLKLFKLHTFPCPVHTSLVLVKIHNNSGCAGHVK